VPQKGKLEWGLLNTAKKLGEKNRGRRPSKIKGALHLLPSGNRTGYNCSVWKGTVKLIIHKGGRGENKIVPQGSYPEKGKEKRYIGERGG